MADDPLVRDWCSRFYPSSVLTEVQCRAERERRTRLMQFVMQRDFIGGTKQFRVFPSIKFAFEYVMALDKEDRTQYETILDTQKRHPYFDVDIRRKHTDPMTHINLIGTLLTTIRRVVGPTLDMVEDLRVYSSHSADVSAENIDGYIEDDETSKAAHGKRSYHVVLRGFWVEDHKEAEGFAKTILSEVLKTACSEDERQFIIKSIDMSVYKRLQQFRLLGCTKIDAGRYKQLVTSYSAYGRTWTCTPSRNFEVDFNESLLTNVQDNCRRLPHHLCVPPEDAIREAAAGGLKDVAVIASGNCDEDTTRAILAMMVAASLRPAQDVEAINLMVLPHDLIIRHLLEAGHLPETLASSIGMSRVTVNPRSVIIGLRACRGGYFCKLCDRVHEHDNPYLLIYQDSRSPARTEERPQVIAIELGCHRDPSSKVRVCSMRANPNKPEAEPIFTCTCKPHDPEVGIVKRSDQYAVSAPLPPVEREAESPDPAPAVRRSRMQDIPDGYRPKKQVGKYGKQGFVMKMRAKKSDDPRFVAEHDTPPEWRQPEVRRPLPSSAD